MDTLLNMLTDHGVEALVQDGELWAIDVYCFNYGPLRHVWFKISPNKRAVLAFLGY